MNGSGYDLLVKGAHLVDGTGAPRARGDLAVTDGRVAAIGDLAEAGARRVVDAAGLVLAPGFIDAHTHDDRLALSDPHMPAKASQGVTSVVVGNCGVSLAPFSGADPTPPMNLLGGREWYRFGTMGEYMAAVRETAPALNLAVLCGHTTLRAGAVPDLHRAAEPAEIDRMAERLDEAMDAGCIGLSTGLAYPPALGSSTDEVVALAERVAERGGVYTTHMRDEGAAVLDSVRETLEVGRRAGLPVVISHHKATGRENWGMTRETLALIARARGEQRVDLDVYPYTASSTVLLADFVEGCERVTVTWSEPHPEFAGHDLESIRGGWGCSVEEAVERLLPAGAIYHQMHEDDLRRVLAFDDAMVGSDGLPHDLCPHPRLWGTFPRVLGHYARDAGLFTLEEAVRRMTSVPAGVFGLEDRGLIREGAAADLVLFDPDEIIDAATYECSTTPATGIREVWVAGETVWRDGTPGTARPGTILGRVSA